MVQRHWARYQPRDVARRVDPVDALSLAHEALVPAEAEGLHLATVDALEAIGSLMVEMDRPREGARVLLPPTSSENDPETPIDSPTATLTPKFRALARVGAEMR